MKVYKLKYLGSTIVCESLAQLLEWIELEVANSGDDDLEFGVEKTHMTETEFQNLPEFQGF